MKIDIRTGISILILVTIIASGSTVPAIGQRVAPPGEQPRYGGTFVYAASYEEPPTFLMASTTVTSAFLVSRNVFNGLLWIDENWQIHPELAQSWETTADGLTWTFHLVQNATFHDGTPLTSADVKFTVEEISMKYHPMGGRVFSAIDHVETPDAYTAVFKLKKPFAPLALALTPTFFTVVPKHLYEGTDILQNPYNFKPIGSGPFKFQEYVPGDHITLVRNENYWQKGKPYLDKLVMRLIPDPASATRALLAGDIDAYLGGITPEDVPQVTKDPRFAISSTEYAMQGGVFNLIFNNRADHITGNQKVRQAILYAIDRDAVREKVGMSLSVPTESIFSPGISWCYNPNPKIKYTYDAAKANQLLDEAGYPRGADGIRFHLKGVGGTWMPYLYKSVEFMVPYLKDVGIILDVERMESSVYNDKVFKNYQYDITTIGISDGPDPNIGMARYITTDSIKGIPFTNVASYSNSKVDELFAAAGAELDAVKRKADLYEIQDILNEDAGMMGLWGEIAVTAWNKDFIGHPMSPEVDGRSESDTWWVNGLLPTVTTATATATATVTTATVTTATVTTATVTTATADYLPIAIVLAAILILAGIYLIVRRRAGAR